jgi:hypothetical protein
MRMCCLAIVLLLCGCADLMQTGYERLDADYIAYGADVGDCVARMGFAYEAACRRNTGLQPAVAAQPFTYPTPPASGSPASVCFFEPGGMILCP